MKARPLLLWFSQIERAARFDVVDMPAVESFTVILPAHSLCELGFNMGSQLGRRATEQRERAVRLLGAVSFQRIP